MIAWSYGRVWATDSSPGQNGAPRMGETASAGTPTASVMKSSTASPRRPSDSIAVNRSR